MHMEYQLNGCFATVLALSSETDSKVHSSFAKTAVLYTKNGFRRHTLITDDRLNKSPNQTWIRELEKCLSTDEIFWRTDVSRFTARGRQSTSSFTHARRLRQE